MPVTLITYATGNYTRAAKLLTFTARRCGVDKTIIYSRKDLVSTAFYTKHRLILDQQRGGGYWLWKPFFILETLRALKEGDFLIYADAGMFFRKKVQPLIDLVKGGNDIALFYNDIRAGHYTKRDVFVQLGCDSQDYYDAPMVHAGLQVYRKTAASLQFAEEVLAACTLDELITDAPNTRGLPNAEGFIEHRHDQSILTALVHKQRRTVYADPSQFLTRNANFEFGKGDIPLATLPYRSIVYIHRYRNTQIWRLVPDTLKKLIS